jgi:GNAT-family acetyltransferase (TIGR03103 family)
MNKHRSEPGDDIQLGQMASLKSWGEPPQSIASKLDQEAIVDCGWGRLILGQTFGSAARLAEELHKEGPGQRDVALYTRDPQVIVSKAPQDFFIDPSLTFRLDLAGAELDRPPPDSIEVRGIRGESDAEAINRIYKARGMVALREGFYDGQRDDAALRILLALDRRDGSVIGCVTGVDHYRAFGDPDNGSSLWALAVDPQCPLPGVGKALVLALAQGFRHDGRSFIDLSVMHDNHEAIQLYRKLGFYQVPVYCIKNKNTINEQLYVGARGDTGLNVYAQIIVDEAYRRGIGVDIVDSSMGYFDLRLGSRSISCRESLSDLTSAVALSRCDDKAVTRRFLQREGLAVPEQTELASVEQAENFLARHASIVIKPARGEQGDGVFVDLRSRDEVARAYLAASRICDKVIGEVFVEGQDLRIIVIDEEVVAAAVRAPAAIVGDGVHSVSDLIAKQSRRRRAATQGESEIPLDDETRRCVEDAGLDMDQILAHGRELQVRKTANLHTGGSMRDVTAELHPELADAAVRGARALDMPLVGFDFIVDDPGAPRYTIIEANERPGLANHEPRPTVERFLDMLFPQTAVNRDNINADA